MLKTFLSTDMFWAYAIDPVGELDLLPVRSKWSAAGHTTPWWWWGPRDERSLLWTAAGSCLRWRKRTGSVMFDRNFSEESEETTEDWGLSPPETAATNRPRKDETRDQTTTDSPPLTYRLKPSKQLPTHPFIHLSYLIHSSTRIRQ